MATIYVNCGQYDRAIDELEQLLQERTNYSVKDFELNAELSPLRKIPRYREMIRRYSQSALSRQP